MDNKNNNLLRKLLDFLRNRIGEGKTLGSDIIDEYDLAELKQLPSDIRNTNLLGLGKIKDLSNLGGGIYQGAQALSNLGELSGAGTNLNDIISDVKSSAYTNPLVNSYLDSNQRKLLRQVQSGAYNTSSASNALGEGLGDAVKALPKAGLAALLGYLSGGGVGAAIQGIGTLANAGIQGATESKQRKASELDNLYSTLKEAEDNYNSMRRPANLLGSGLQTRYSRQLY